MTLSTLQFNNASTRLIAAAALAFSLISAPAMAAPTQRLGHEQRAEMRIKEMHDRLMITQTQEEQWAKVAKVMSDNARTMDKLTQARIDQAKTMNAVEDLKSYGEITESHAEGIRTLTPVFATLYTGMSDPQKKQADILFSHGGRNNRDGNRGPRARAPK